jgi:hypothetical protein
MTTNTLASGASLTAGQSLVSNNGIYALIVSPNGLVYMEIISTLHRYWSIGRIGQGNPVLTMQPDGNLVLHEGNPPALAWASGTQGNPGAYAVLCDNGNLVIYDASGVPIWSSNTAQGAVAAAPAALVEIRASLESALAKLSVVERALAEINLGRSAAKVLERGNEANVNVRNYNANAE